MRPARKASSRAIGTDAPTYCITLNVAEHSLGRNPQRFDGRINDPLVRLMKQ